MLRFVVRTFGQASRANSARPPAVTTSVWCSVEIAASDNDAATEGGTVVGVLTVRPRVREGLVAADTAVRLLAAM